MPIAFDEDSARHLLRRTGFAASDKQVQAAVDRGLDKTLAHLLAPQPKPPKFPKGVDSLPRLQTWWLERMAKARWPLVEKLTLFWHDHFATAVTKVQSLERIQQHVMTLRTHALGPFRELVLAVARDPAMLVWLDNKDSFAGSLNENFARELMELFTTGVLDQDGQPNYTEDDVVDVARAFTGWTLDDAWAFEFRPDLHDDGTKTVKGVTGALGGEDVVDILLADPATARRVCSKLWTTFAYDVALDDPVVDDLVAAWDDSGGAIGEVLDALFRHEAFWSDEARQPRIKGPAEFFVSAVKTLRGKFAKNHPWSPGHHVSELGQALFDPPTVFGWDEGLSWVGTSGMLERAHVADWFSEQRGKDAHVRWVPEKLLGKGWKQIADGDEVVERVLAAFGMSDVAGTTRAALEAYVVAPASGALHGFVVDDDFVDTKVRGLVAILMASPEFQTT